MPASVAAWKATGLPVLTPVGGDALSEAVGPALTLVPTVIVWLLTVDWQVTLTESGSSCKRRTKKSFAMAVGVGHD